MDTHPLQKAVCVQGSSWTPGFRTESVFCAVDDKGIHRGGKMREECVKQIDTGSSCH